MQPFETFPAAPAADAGSWWGILASLAVLALISIPLGLSLIGHLRSRRSQISGPADPAVAWSWEEPSPDAVQEVAYRRESWELPDGSRAAMFLVASNGACVVHALVAAPGGSSLRCGRDVFAHAAIRSDRDAVLAALPTGPADSAILHLLRVFDGADAFLGEVHNLSGVLLSASSNWGAFNAVSGAVRPTATGKVHPVTGHAEIVPDEGSLGDICYLIPDILPAPAQAGSEPDILVTGDPRGEPEAVAADRGRLRDFLAGWHAEATALSRPGGLDRGAWTQEVYAFLGASGPAGGRRLQAAALHRAFVPLMPRLPEVVAAIDAGRPFEETLMLEVDAISDWRAVRPLDMARMRRLRGLAHTPGADSSSDWDRRGGGIRRGDDFRAVMWVATAFPLERLPRTGEGWRRILPSAVEALGLARRWALPLEGLLAGLPPEWDVGDLAGTPGAQAEAVLHALRGRQIGLQDMVRRFAQTVVEPAGIPGHRRGHAFDGYVGTAERQAAHMLLAGRTFRAVMAIQDEWHERLSVLERALPPLPGEADYVWPALFRPLSFNGDVSLRCLVNSAELRDEGAQGPDINGVRGLAHCVGGYARGCARGDSHIVSVTGPGEDGRRTRLSTIELTMDGERGRVRQHRGLRNADPPGPAKAAEAALLSLIAGGQITLDPAALERREPVSEPVGSYDIAAAVTAWDRYLTPEGRGRCRDLVAAHAGLAEDAGGGFGDPYVLDLD